MNLATAMITVAVHYGLYIEGHVSHAVCVTILLAKADTECTLKSLAYNSVQSLFAGHGSYT